MIFFRTCTIRKERTNPVLSPKQKYVMSSSNSMINPYLYLVFFNFNSNRCGRFVSTRERLEMSLMYIKLSYRISAFFCNDTQVYELEILESTTTYCSQWRHKHKVLITTYHKIQKKFKWKHILHLTSLSTYIIYGRIIPRAI